MIGNKILDSLYEFNDVSSSLNQLCDLINTAPKEITRILNVQLPNLEKLTKEETRFITILASVIDYKLQELSIEVPNWLRDERLILSEPFYLDKRLDDLDKLKLFIKSTGPFRNRNVFIAVEGLTRV